MTKASNYVAQFNQPTFTNPTTGKIMPNDNGWQDRHMAALRAPRGVEVAIVNLLAGWAKYADEHFSRYDSRITDDYVLGDEWVTIGRAIRALLNGECGRLECATLDAFICDTLRSVGVPNV